MLSSSVHIRMVRLVGVLVLLCASVSSITGCAPESASARDSAPRILRLAYLPSEEDPEGRMDAVQLLSAHLEKHVGLPVEIIRAVQYAPTIEALRAGKIDLVRAGGPFVYLVAHEKAGAEALIAFGTSEGPGLYRSLIVTHPGSGLRTLDDLVDRAGEIDFAFVTPTSASGHLVPRALLEGEGLVPERDFSQLVYTMSHTNSAMTILAGKVDAGAISINTWQRLIDKGRIQEEDLVVLWRSEPVPTGPLMVDRNLPESIKESIRQAYLAIDDDEDSALYQAMQVTYQTEDLRFYPISDAHWDGLRTIARSVDSMQMLPEL